MINFMLYEIFLGGSPCLLHEPVYSQIAKGPCLLWRVAFSTPARRRLARVEEPLRSLQQSGGPSDSRPFAAAKIETT